MDGGKSPSLSPEEGEIEIDNNDQRCCEAPMDGDKRENSEKRGTPGKGNKVNMMGTPSPRSSTEQSETETDNNIQHCYEVPKDEGK
ncbi:hypothetical protein, partial [Escherichia coli]|uniref:hypothetical protein n=1 Tax=Escherichia coli TaxID=562 RepID=UPI0014132C16